MLVGVGAGVVVGGVVALGGSGGRGVDVGVVVGGGLGDGGFGVILGTPGIGVTVIMGVDQMTVIVA